MNQIKVKFDQKSPWLAPLAGFTDLPFRLLCREQGAEVCCTEMVSSKGLVYSMKSKEQKSNTIDLLSSHEEDKNLVVQVFGAEAPFVHDSILILKDMGFGAFDLNIGCSVPKVTKTGAGAAMLRDIPNTLEVAAAMLKAAKDCPVGFKMRLGWDKSQTVFLELAKELEGLGASWLCLHPRYARQNFSGEADWEQIKLLKEKVNIPVIASGDIFTAKDAIRCLKNSTADTVMFARGAINSPAVFKFYDQAFKIWNSCADQENLSDSDLDKKLEGLVEILSAQELHGLILRHAELGRKHSPKKAGKKGYSPALLKMRTVVPRYARYLKDVKELRQSLVHCKSWEDFERLMEEFFLDKF